MMSKNLHSQDHVLKVHGLHKSISARILAQHIQQLEPEKDAARLALLNFLTYLMDPQDEFGAKELKNFCVHALSFGFWQENWSHMQKQLRFMLSSLSDQTPFGLEELLQDSAMQCVQVQGTQNQKILLQTILEKSIGAHDKAKLIELQDRQHIGLIIHPDNSLSIKIFNSQFVLFQGEWLPCQAIFGLSYDAGLNLNSQKVHQLPIAPHTSARFTMGDRGCVGQIVRGYTFQKYEELKGGYLAQYPLLFYPLKQMERIFIDPKSDPVYLETTQILERASEWIQDDQLSDYPQRLQQAQLALQRGKQVFENIYSDDKMLKLLVSHLEKSLALGRSNIQNSPVYDSSIEI